MAGAMALRDDMHALQVHLPDMGRERPQRRQRLFIGIDHIAKVEKRVQARMADPAQQGGDRGFSVLVLLEVEVQIVQVGQIGQIAQVGLDQVHDLRQLPS